MKIIKDYYKKDTASLQESRRDELCELYQRIIELEKHNEVLYKHIEELDKQVEHINNYLAQNECYD